MNSPSKGGSGTSARRPASPASDNLAGAQCDRLLQEGCRARLVPDPVELLVLTGPVGSGKTRILDAVAELLRRADVDHVAVDMDGLCGYWPWTHGDPFNRPAGLRALEVMCKTARERGIRHVLLAEVLEHPDDVTRYAAAAAATSATVVRLALPAGVLATRIESRGRDVNVGQELARAAELAELMASASVGDLVVANSGTPLETAAEILSQVGWI